MRSSSFISVMSRKVLASSFDRGQSISKEVARKLQLAVSDHRHAFVYVDGERSLRMAAEADERLSMPLGNVTLLCGGTISIKDNFAVMDEPVKGCSKILSGYIAPNDSTVAERLKVQNAVILGRTNMDEFGMGSSTTNSPFGSTVNPWTAPSADPLCAGGSSGGAAVSVAAGIVDAAIGSDTGGSVRHPASFCGVVGLKPSYGTIPRHGLLSYASSMDCPGIISNCVLDAAIVLDGLAGFDARDPTSIDDRSPSETVSFAGNMPPNSHCISLGHASSYLLSNYPADSRMFQSMVSSAPYPFRSVTPNELVELEYKYENTPIDLSGINIGIPEEFSFRELDADVLYVWNETIKAVEDAGATIKIVTIPSIKMALPCYYVLACAEAASNLSRYDGIRYGFRYGSEKLITSDQNKSSSSGSDYTQSQQSSVAFMEEIANTRGLGFGQEVIKRIITGNFVLSQSAFHDYFGIANTCRQKIRQEISSCMSGSNCETIHALLGPTTPVLPFPIKEPPDPSRMLLNDLYTIQANLAGLPAITIPAGISKNCSMKDARPVGMQFMGRYRHEPEMLKIARAAEQRLNFRNCIPTWVRDSSREIR